MTLEEIQLKIKTSRLNYPPWVRIIYQIVLQELLDKHKLAIEM